MALTDDLTSGLPNASSDRLMDAWPRSWGANIREVIGRFELKIVLTRRVKKCPNNFTQKGLRTKIRTVAVPDRASGEFDTRQLEKTRDDKSEIASTDGRDTHA